MHILSFFFLNRNFFNYLHNKYLVLRTAFKLMKLKDKNHYKYIIPNLSKIS